MSTTSTSVSTSFVTTADATQIYYKDWGHGQPVVFSHGWPLNADAWDDQMFFLASNGYRTIAHDRRGHGRSSQPWQGNNMDTYADDLAAVMEALNLQDVMLVGHSTGGGEVTRYMGRHGTSRVARAVLVGAIPPLMLKTDANPGGLPIDVFNGLRNSVATDGLRLHQGLLRDRPHRGFEEDRRADAHYSRRRRPDCADCRLGVPVGEDRSARDIESLRGSTSWPGDDA